MSARDVCVALAALAVITTAGDSRTTSVPLRHVHAARFPVGVGEPIAERSCTACHSPMLVTQQSKDSTAWEKTLTQMQKWGVTLTEAERDTLRGYLVAQFGPRRVVPR